MSEEAVEKYKQFLAEGNSYEQSSNFQQAINCYTMAINAISEGGQIQDEALGQQVLCMRSRCLLRVGETEDALADAERVLKTDEKYLKGLFAKAEALYFKGDFEFALVFYYRGFRACEKSAGPAKQFTLGIQKAKEAIDNAIGNVEHCRLSDKGDLAAYYAATASDEPNKKGAGVAPSRRRQGTAGKRGAKPGKSDKTVASLLGELYADKQYLEDLMKDSTLVGDLGNQVKGLATSGATYLDKRTEFWRQQKPIYARVNEAKVNAQKQTMKGSAGRTLRAQAKPQKVLDTLERIETAMEDGDPDKALSLAQRALKTANECLGADKDKLVGSVYSAMGSAHMDLGDLEAAMENHTKDLMLAQKTGSSEAESRALGNIGRVHASHGNFDLALESWLKKVPLCTSPLECAWLYHEIGRCYFAKDNYVSAKEMGEKSKTCATEADEPSWQLNALVLMGQAQANLGDLQEAVMAYGDAMKIARDQEDDAAVESIETAIAETRAKMVVTEEGAEGE